MTVRPKNGTSYDGTAARNSYDPAGRRTFETNANTEVLQLQYDSGGSLTALTDGNAHTTRWNYDAYGRVTNKLDQASAEILRYAYDVGGQLTNRWSAAKGNTRYSYDAAGNLTSIDYPSSPDVTFTYDRMGRLTNMVDAVGTTRYTYTSTGRLLTEDGPFSSDTVTNSYKNGLRVALSLQQPTGAWTNGFLYDASRRLTNVTSSAGSFGYHYSTGVDASGVSASLVKSLLLPNQAVITNDFDGVARLLGTHLRTSTGVLTNKHQYLYNLAGQRTNETRIDASTVAYRYDAIGQLKIADSSLAAEDRGYSYDAAWNLHYRTNNGALGTLSVNSLNEIVSATGTFASGFLSAPSAQYDTNGNLTQFGDSNMAFRYSYDDENRLVQWQNYSIDSDVIDDQTQFFYDGLGRLRARVEFDPDSSPELWPAVLYIYDGRRVIQERSTSAGQLLSGTPAVSYTRGLDLSGTLEGAGGIGGLLARSDGYSSGNWTTHNFYHSDAGGNITFMLSTSQGSAARYVYDAYGNLISSSGAIASANLYRFSSKELHVNSDLYYYGYRFYYPDLQMWPNRDPLGEAGGINLYDFVYNSPFGYYDPDGLLGTPAENIALVLALGEEEAAEILGPAAARAAANAIAAGATGAAVAGGAAVCEMSKRPARNRNRIGHRGGNDAETHEDAQGHGGREKPNFTPSKKRPPAQPPREPSPKPGRQKFPNPGQAPK